MTTFRQELVLAVIVALALGRTTAHMIMLAAEKIAARFARRAANRREYGA